MRILLIHPCVLNDTPQPPLGIAYIASYLNTICKYDVHLVDLGNQSQNSSISILKEEIRKFDPQIIGVSFLTPQYEPAMEYFKIVKSLRKDIFTVAGGIHTSALPLEILNQDEVDFVVIGEGEITMAELAKSIESDEKSFDSIRGLGYKKDGGPIINPPRELITDLNTLPIPFWKDLSNYTYTDLSFRYGEEHKQEIRYFPIFSSRGCPNNCNFCAVQVISKRKLRFRSPENVFNEIRHLYDNFDARYFQIIDDTATTKRENMIALCRLIIDSGLRIKWGCKSRVNTVDPEMLGYMREAGCRLISYGVESGDPEILKTIRKNITLEQVRNALTMTKKAGILTETYFMVGNLGETWSSVDRTISLIKEIDVDYVSCSIVVPFPGTEIYSILKQKGWLRESNYSKFNAAFHFVGDTLPIMRTEAMSQKELLKAYYKVNGGIVIKKMKTAYGNRFYLNPAFYKREFFFRLRIMGSRRFISVVYNLFVNKLVELFRFNQ